VYFTAPRAASARTAATASARSRRSIGDPAQPLGSVDRCWPLRRRWRCQTADQSREIRRHAIRRVGLAALHAVEKRRTADVIRMRMASGEQFLNHQAEREHVAGGRCGLAARLLRTHVGQCAHDEAARRLEPGIVSAAADRGRTIVIGCRCLRDADVGGC
jgi:hypothetical protein